MTCDCLPFELQRLRIVRENKQVNDWKRKRKKGGKIKNFPKQTWRVSLGIEGSSMDFFAMSIARNEEGEKEESV
jgi:hypothetical protein